MSSRTVNVINALYGREVRSRRSRLLECFLPRRMRSKVDARRREKGILALYGERNKTLTRGRIVLLIIAAIISGLAFTSIFYFNRLTRYEQDVFKEKAKIDSLLQRRRNISINLARTVRDYAVHEQEIFQHVSNMRGSSKDKNQSTAKEEGLDKSKVQAMLGGEPTTETATAGKDPKSGGILGEVLSMLDGSSAGAIPLDKKLAGLMAVAESYPDLKLSNNFQRFMEALVETEKELSDRRMTYTEVVNTYTTQLKTLPGKVFAMAYGFDPFPYYVADTDAQSFSPVEY